MGKALIHFGMGVAGLADTGQIALHVGHKDRHTEAGKLLGQHLQGDRLAGAGGASHQAMAVGKTGLEQ